MTDGDLCPPKNMEMSPDKEKKKTPLDLTSLSNNFVNNNNEKLGTKSPPQRPPPPKMELIDLGQEGALPLTNHSCPVIEPSPSVGWQSSTIWSTSSSEPETPSQHGKVSLRISESCLRSSSPGVVHDDDDDEVFVKELETFPVFVPPSPPPFLPPSLEDALLRESQEKMPDISAAPLEKNLHER